MTGSWSTILHSILTITKAATGEDDDLWEGHGDDSKKRARTSGSRNSASRINEDSGDGGQKTTK